MTALVVMVAILAAVVVEAPQGLKDGLIPMVEPIAALDVMPKH